MPCYGVPDGTTLRISTYPTTGSMLNRDHPWGLHADVRCMLTPRGSLLRYLASRGSKVYMVCRNEERGSKAKEEISSRLEAQLPVGSWSPSSLELMIAGALWRRTDPTMLETVDMAGRVCMVTGANSGIGKEIAE